jgi:hypothetical protein
LHFIGLAFIFKLTKKREGGLGEGEKRDGGIRWRGIEEEKCERIFLCLS